MENLEYQPKRFRSRRYWVRIYILFFPALMSLHIAITFTMSLLMISYTDVLPRVPKPPIFWKWSWIIFTFPASTFFREYPDDPYDISLAKMILNGLFWATGSISFFIWRMIREENNMRQ
jgi:hypothetical protein